jgi:hypothetical protein
MRIEKATDWQRLNGQTAHDWAGRMVVTEGFHRRGDGTTRRAARPGPAKAGASGLSIKPACVRRWALHAKNAAHTAANEQGHASSALPRASDLIAWGC